MPSDEPIVSHRLADLCSDVSYGYTASAIEEPVGPRFLRITDIQGGRFDWGNVPHCEAGPNAVRKYGLAVGDIVIARTGNSTGENAQIWSVDEPAVFASYLIRFRVDERLANPFFVGYQLRSVRFRDFVMAVRGGGIPRLVTEIPLSRQQFTTIRCRVFFRFNIIYIPRSWPA